MARPNWHAVRVGLHWKTRQGGVHSLNGAAAAAMGGVGGAHALAGRLHILWSFCRSHRCGYPRNTSRTRLYHPTGDQSAKPARCHGPANSGMGCGGLLVRQALAFGQLGIAGGNAWWIAMAACRLDGMLDAEQHDILDPEAFRAAHQQYLLVSTVQWILALVSLAQALWAWRKQDAKGLRQQR